jgi:phage tail sheath protein FI
MMYVMDIPAYDDTRFRLWDGTTTKPSVRYTSEEFVGRAVDNNYVSTYFPDVHVNDEVNGRRVIVPPSVAVLGAMAFNDKVSYPWFAPAGFNRGALDFVTNAKVRLNSGDRDTLYSARINPIAVFPTGGYVIFGQKTLQLAKTALDRVNVRRLMIEVKRVVAGIANSILFEQNTPTTRAKFVSQVTPRLALIQAQAGIEKFRVVMDETNNTQVDVENNRVNGKIVVVPTKAVEFISIDFVITNAGVQFE